MSDPEDPPPGRELQRSPANSKAKRDLTPSLRPAGGSRDSGGAGSSKESGGSGGSLGATSGSSMSNPPLVADVHTDRDDADPEGAVGLRKSFRQMGIRPPRAFDPKTDRNF